MVAASSVLALPLSIVLNNLLSALAGREEAVSFIAATLVAPAGFAVGAAGGGLAIARRDRARAVPFILAGAGSALFPLYGLFALVVTTIERGNPAYQAPIEAVVLSLSALAMAAGAITAIVSLARRPRTGRPIGPIA